MEYDWEKHLPTSLFHEIEDRLEDYGLHLIGLAVEKNGEAALILYPEVPTGGVMMADVFGDIWSDARKLYNFSVANILDDAK